LRRLVADYRPVPRRVVRDGLGDGDVRAGRLQQQRQQRVRGDRLGGPGGDAEAVEHLAHRDAGRLDRDRVHCGLRGGHHRQGGTLRRGGGHREPPPYRWMIVVVFPPGRMIVVVFVPRSGTSVAIGAVLPPRGDRFLLAPAGVVAPGRGFLLSRVVASAGPAAVTRLGTAEGLTGSPPSAGRPCATQGPQTRASTPPTAGPLPPVRCGPPQRGSASPAPQCA